jgi:hypothetical protein
MGEILVITRESYWRAAGAMKLPHLAQYDRFIGMRDGIGELLEMLMLAPKIYNITFGHSQPCLSFLIS